MKKFIKKHKGLTIFLCIVLVVGALIGWSMNKEAKEKKTAMEMMMRPEAVEVERRNLVKLVPATGTVISIAQKGAKAELSGVKVEDVFVKVGDFVEEGQLLCTLDSGSVEAELEIAEKNRKVSDQSSSLNLASAKRQLNDVQEAQAYSEQQYNDQLKNLELNRNAAEEELKKYTDNYNSATNKRKDWENKINEGKNRISEIDVRLTTITDELNLLPVKEAVAQDATIVPVEETLENSEEETIDLQEELRKNLVTEAEALAQEKEELMNAIQGWTAEFNTAMVEEQAAYEIYIAKAKAVESAKNAYEAAVKNGEHNAKTYVSQLAGAKDNLTNVSGSISVSDLSAKQQIEQLKEKLAACKVYAPISGVVTSVTVEKGEVYMGTPVATIEDISGFAIQTYISEYEIGKICEGQEVVIKINATGDLLIKGTVQFISPRAAQYNIGATGDVEYGVIVSIDEPVEGLRMDMTARMNIILEKAENVLTVPYDYVQIEEDGRKYVEVQTEEKKENGQNKTKKVYVTTGLEGDYYIELLSDDLAEGAKVVMPGNEFATMDINAMIENEGALGGY